MSSSRDIILASVRRSLGVNGTERPRRDLVEDRLQRHPTGLIPERGISEGSERVQLFCERVEASGASVERLAAFDKVPEAVAAYLRDHNLPGRIRFGADKRLEAMPFATTALEVARGPSDGKDLAGLSVAFAGIAETGTLVMTASADNPTTLNFLPDYHLVVIEAAAISDGLERGFEMVRAEFGAGNMPRVVNLVTGPSRSADIEQKLLFGAHGPRSLHVMVIG